MMQSKIETEHSARYFEEVSQNYDLLNVTELQRRTSIIINDKPSIKDPSITKKLQRSNTILADSLRDINSVLEIIKYNQVWEVDASYLDVFKKTILIRQQQNRSILFYDNLNFNRISQVPTHGEEFQVTIDSEHPINLKMLQLCLDEEKQFLLQFRREVGLILDFVRKQDSMSAKTHIIQAKITHSKVYTIAEQLPSACIFPAEDLLNLKDVFCQRWQILKDQVRYRCYGSEGTVQASFEPLKEQIIWANAMINRLNDGENLQLPLPVEAIGYLKKGLTIFQMLFVKEDARREAEKFISQPTENLTRKVWNLTDQGITKHMLKVIFPSIGYSNKISIPRVLNQITEQFVRNSKGTSTLTTDLLKEKYRISHPNQYKNSLYVRSTNKVSIRINCPFDLDSQGEVGDALLSKLTNIFKNKPTKVESLVMHIHGGGFIGMSSYSHQIYTRKWANELKVPIFSVDYRKAPQFPYPSALDDCFQTYLWLLYAFEQVFLGQPKKIIVVGDSAGGNLAAALTCLLIKLNLRIPDGVFLVYPALNLDDKAFTPSLLFTLNDYILPHTVLKLCAKAYLQKYENKRDYLLSPIYAPSEILCRFPFTRIYVGSKDPFSDDCYRLTEKLMIEKRNVELTIYQSFTHGFLQFDNILMPIAQARQAVSEICNDMGQRLQQMD